MIDAPVAPVLVVVPAYQEAAAIASVVQGAARHLPVLVVDDGSSDTTAERARAAGATVLVQPSNQGKGAALRAGFRWAIDHGFAGALTIDGDGQHDPADIPAFLDAWHRFGPDLIVGQRNFRRMPPVRRVANTLGGIAFSWAVGSRVPDNQSGFRLVGRRLMEVLLASREAGFEFEVEMITRCLAEGWPIRWVPIRTIYRGEVSQISAGRHLGNFLRVVAVARREMRGRR